ncbi:hypothetical protein BDY17DRAFT_291937 [Neohortaea acidophila]|uniref:EF hand domain-containing protein n=1 Tax=Neohortaea acidophila TaxID=245834 RepID=A0A6A6Q314_9PEZI|nr:uncharacterized protein BDY17DRAFT_291937 [Neohortaea acidophila]KAF2486685.1 hypothetical protein BDY17DRAFT_291937 [Neohortaea acidophila]
MSSTTLLSRTRTAVLAFSGLAAAYGIYYVYTSSADHAPTTTLHRSNAVHRTRPERRPSHRFVLSTRPPDDDAPLGMVVMHRTATDERFEFNIAFLQGVMPDDVGLRYDMRITSAQATALASRLRVAAVECLLNAAVGSQSDTQRQAIARFGLADLSEALMRRDYGTVQLLSPDVLRLLKVEPEEYQVGLERFRTPSLYTNLFVHDVPADDSSHAPTEDLDGLDGAARETTHGLKSLLYHIAAADAKRKSYEHRGIHCEECGERPIRGVRWHCLNCPDFDLCSTCEATIGHLPGHVLAKIQIPLPLLSQPTKEIPLWYPGDPKKVSDPLSASFKLRLGERYDFDEPHMDAHYDQFICIANTSWPADPNQVGGAIDRHAFNKALTSERWPQRFRPNAMYDRMFAFYDTDHDGLIGFEEFVDGLAYLRGNQRFADLRRALQGFDFDGDGYVDRADFIRLLRAKHEMHKLVITDAVESRDEDLAQRAASVLRTAQPISSLFTNDDPQPGEDRPRNGKHLDLSTNDLVPASGTHTILGDNEGWEASSNAQVSTTSQTRAELQPHEQLQHHMSRFEEVLERSEATDAEASRAQAQPQQDTEQAVTASGPQVADSIRSMGFIDADVGTGMEDEDALDEDVLWQVIEAGLHELLDPLFKEKEEQDDAVVATREERAKLRMEIDQAVQDKQAFREELATGSDIDPLLAIANESYTQANGRPRKPRQGLAFSNTPVSTDAASLEQREAEIAQRPLGELLDNMGYSVVDGETGSGHSGVGEDVLPADAGMAVVSHSPETTRILPGPTHLERTGDPTMPQNRPNRPSSGERDDVDERAEDRSRLEYLASLDEAERAMQERGGPGRLNVAEMEACVRADGSKELRGIVTSWLEWASF